MPAVLGEKQFELGDVVFGWGRPVQVFSDGWTPGQAVRNTQDEANPAGDGVRFGVDRDGSATWGFKMFTNGATEGEAWSAVGELGAVWSGDDHRDTPSIVVPLRYRVAGETRRVYGRPRRWTITPDNQSLAGRIDITADFATVDNMVYEDILRSQELTLQPPVTPGIGLTVPFTPPTTMSAEPSKRVDRITVGGTKPTPVTLVFTGPVANAAVTVAWDAAPGRPAGSWTAALVDPVVEDNSVTIDAAPWVRSAVDANGGGVRVSPRVTRISKMTIPPGTHSIVFTGVDSTGGASVEVSWRSAHRLPR